MIRLVDVVKRFSNSQSLAVDHLSLDIEEGETAVLVGPSGCGKTTTMKMINRLVEPTSGRDLRGRQGRHAAGPRQLRRGIGYVIQTIGLMPHRTIAQNIATVPRAARLGGGPRQGAGSPSWSSMLELDPSYSPATRASCPAASASGWASPGPSPPTRR